MDERKIQKIEVKSKFEDAVNKILELIKYKEEKLKTLLVPCMIDLAMEENKQMHKDLKFWSDKDVFAYIR